MISNQHPTKQPGPQNPFCPFFNDCMLDVFNRQWEIWSCTDCPLKKKNEPEVA